MNWNKAEKLTYSDLGMHFILITSSYKGSEK